MDRVVDFPLISPNFSMMFFLLVLLLPPLPWPPPKIVPALLGEICQVVCGRGGFCGGVWPLRGLQAYRHVLCGPEDRAGVVPDFLEGLVVQAKQVRGLARPVFSFWHAYFLLSGDFVDIQVSSVYL